MAFYDNDDPFFPNEDKDKAQTESKQENTGASQTDNRFAANYSTRGFFENQNQGNSASDPFGEKQSEEKKPDEQKDYGFLDGAGGANGNGADGGNGGQPYYIVPTPQKKEKRGIRYGLLVLIMIPILVITNVLTSLYVFDNVWTDATTKYTAEINEILAKETYLPADSDLIALSVGKKCIDGVLEIKVTYPNGSAAGTGFVITKDGYVLSNAHVVTYEKTVYQGRQAVTKIEPVSTVTANFYNSETKYTLSIVAYDSDLDVAVLKFDSAPANLTVLELADSGLLSYGEPAVAIGNAQGYGLALTEGVISAPIQYFDLGSSSMTAAIQHSAAINPGNSGGPLFNMYGQVVGINTFKLSNDNTEISIDGMGFAIPTSVVKDYVNGLNISGLSISFVTNTDLLEAA